MDLVRRHDTSRIPASTQPSPGAAGVALDRMPSGNGHRTPVTVAPAVLEDRTDAERYGAAAPDARSQVRALVTRERAGGPTVTGRGRRRAYELLRDAHTEEEGTA